ncbi:MAG: FecR domain-containing protein [Gammaproteobacteria bacterium]
MYRQITHKPVISGFITSRIILVGLLILISFSTIATEVVKRENNLSDEWIYTVKQGDNLWNLTEDFLVDIRYWRKLQTLNNINQPSRMRPGSTLRIPREWSRIRPSEATIKSFSGDVIVTASGNEKNVSTDMKLVAGDQIQTGSEAFAKLIFEDGSMLILRENSELILQTLESYGNKDVFNTRLELKRGRSDNQVNPDKKSGSRFEINTPSATAAVRGTSYRINVIDQKSMTTEVLEGEVNVANETGKTGVEGGFGTLAKKGEPPTPPVVLLPAPVLSQLSGSVDQLPIKFQLPEIKGAQAYRVQVASDSKFLALDYDDLSLTTSARINELSDGKYFMKVRGVDINSIEGFDSKHVFVLNAKPEAPLILEPQSGQTVSSNHRKFSWTKNTDAKAYHFQLANNLNFDQPLIDVSDYKETSTDISQPLSPGKWFWRVTALDAEGAGPDGSVNEFRVMKPGAKMDAASIDESEIIFRWSVSDESDRYQIQIASDKNFEKLLVNKELDKAEYIFPKPKSASTIFVRIRVIEFDGFKGAWGSVQQLNIPGETLLWLLGLVPLLLFL